MIELSVCIGSACHISGAHNVVATFQHMIEKYELHDKIDFKASFCMKQCSAEGVAVTINGEKFAFPDAKPFIDERSRTLVPLRFISEALGAEVAWDGETKTVTITKGEDVISYTVGEMKADKNGEEITFDTYGMIKEDRTFVPVRYISELLGCSVDWDGATKTVKIN